MDGAGQLELDQREPSVDFMQGLTYMSRVHTSTYHPAAAQYTAASTLTWILTTFKTFHQS